jgi:hypothetical protein
MVIDPILRFNWIFYVVITGQLQTSAVLSFSIAFSEVCRRGIWTIFRVENEHCTNVERFRASRDVPLPYKFKQPETIAEEGGVLTPLGEEEEMDWPQREEQRRQGIKPSPSSLARIPSRASGTSLHRTQTQPSIGSTVRRRRRLEASPLMRKMGSILHVAHAQDFERKKRPEAGAEVEKSSEDENDDDDDDTSDGVEQELEQQFEEAERFADGEMTRVDGGDDDFGKVKRSTGTDEDEEANSKSAESAEGGVHWKFSDVDEGDEERGEMSSGRHSPGGHLSQ